MQADHPVASASSLLRRHFGLLGSVCYGFSSMAYLVSITGLAPEHTAVLQSHQYLQLFVAAGSACMHVHHSLQPYHNHVQQHTCIVTVHESLTHVREASGV